MSNSWYRIFDRGPWTRPTSTVVRTEDVTASGIVFSKDRPLQLDALIRSYVANVSPIAPLSIIFSASSTRYEDAYVQLAAVHGGPNVRFVSEREAGGFRSSLLSLLDEGTGDVIFFLVDDIVFTEPVDMALMARYTQMGFIPSLRLGRNISWSYTRQCPQPLPPFKVVIQGLGQSELHGNSHPRLLAWTWRSGTIDWRYPLSVDGNLFTAREIEDLIKCSDFVAPNSLEQALQAHIGPLLNRWGICHEKSRLVNIPINRVQDVIQNLHGDIHQDQLLQMWCEGLRLDIEPLQGFMSTSAHEEVPLLFTSRPT